MQDTNREEEIRRRAYELWEREGRPEGRDTDHWSDAESELAGGSVNGDDAGQTAKPPRKERKAKA